MTFLSHINPCCLRSLMRTPPIPLRARLGLEIVFLHRLARLDRRKLKRRTLPSLQPRPPAHVPPIRPRQQPHPRLHVPMQRQRRIRALRHQPRGVGDLVLGFLVGQAHDARLRARGIRFAGPFRLGLCFRLARRFGGGMDVCVGMRGRAVRGHDGVPDHGFGAWDCGWRGRWV